MDLSQSTIQSLVYKMKQNIFSNPCDHYSFISPSAYDTAWLAMIPDPHQPSQPMFKNCLDWVLHNQKEDGSWGDSDAHGMPTIECLPATLACIVTLKKWNVGTICIERGLAFIHANTEKFLREMNNDSPRWFAIVFPGMVELAHTVGVELFFLHRSNGVVSELFNRRQQILENEKLENLPLSYLEALPASYDIDEDDIIKHLNDDGSLFQSPSATASAFMATGNNECMAYLLSLVQRCDGGVPATYPIDEELIKLCMVNQLFRLGLAEHFVQEAEEVLAQVYRNYLNQESREKPSNSIEAQLFKDSLAFRFLRMHGYDVSSDSFCWFLHHEDIRDQIENNHEYFSTAMLNVYRATDLMFSGEYDLQEARSFSKKLLEKTTSSNLRRLIEHELSLPWFARLDHLEHRMWIEEKDSNILWMGKASPHRLSCPRNDEIVRLAMQNYEFRQSVYKKELEELKRWSKDWGLSDIGFGREKTTYCYFSVASSCSLPYNSDIRMMVAKSAIIITVADDFFDMEGSLIELKDLTNAVQRWDAKGLSGHSKIIFDALDNLVREIATEYLQQEGRDIINNLQDIWYETFASWFTESKWGKTGSIPSMDEYLETGMTSIAAHTIVLPASCLLNPTLPISKLRPEQYESITKLLMVIARLLNDVQSFQKEQDEGTINSVLLYLKDSPEADIEESIAFVREIVDKKKKEFLEHVLMDGYSDLPKPCKHLHLSCLKVFQMFFNSTNGYDSNTEMLQDISKAIYIPIEVGNSKRILKPLPRCSGTKEEDNLTTNCYINRPRPSTHYRRSFGTPRVSWSASRDYGYGKMFIAPKVRFCFT
ncbi:(E,E)-geranyllinalool synthase-like [Alnus glutinosa]|uniref:(E,E)-geranyllinalool synthase-like n=1 Tax=Alnus glutinosa TaxID=3517 RepID=UPI002D7744A0|nr:(E,E)-geranyllinalool synthase-like [Alnus glutinosa]